MQLAALFNLALHAAGTDPRKMPSDAELGLQAKRIIGIPDFQQAVSYLSDHEQELAAFLDQARTMDSEAFARELDACAAKAQLAADPKAEPHPNVMFRLKMKIQREANEGLYKSSTGQDIGNTWSTRAVRDRAMENFLNYCAMNRLMQTHPYRVYFSEPELHDSFLQSIGDERLMKEYAKTASRGPVGLRADIFSYSGLGYLSSMESLEEYAVQIPRAVLNLSSKEGLLNGALQLLGFLTELKKTGSLENNYYAGEMQSRIFLDYPKTPECKSLWAALILDYRELGRINARLLHLNGSAYMEEYNKVVAECRRPLDLDRRAAQDRETMLGIGNAPDVFIRRNEPEMLRVSLANLLTAALYQDLPQAERPNAEAFLAQRNLVLDMPELRQAADWLAARPEACRRLAQEPLNAARLAARLDEACRQQHAAEKRPGSWTPSIRPQRASRASAP